MRGALSSRYDKVSTSLSNASENVGMWWGSYEFKEHLLLMIAWAITLGGWGLWVGLDHDMSTYATLYYDVTHRAVPDTYDWNVKYLVSIPAWTYFAYHTVLCMPWLSKMLNINKGHSASRTGLRAVINGFTTVLTLNVLGVTSIWLLLITGVSVTLIASAEFSSEDINKNHASGLSWAQRIPSMIMNLSMHHIGVGVIAALMISIVVEEATEERCYWNPISYGILTVWATYNMFRILAHIFQAIFVLHEEKSWMMFNLSADTLDFIYHTTILFLVLGLLSEENLRCANPP